MAKKIRVLVLADEALGRKRLLRFLKTQPDIEVADPCTRGPEAIAAIRQGAPEILFLDVHKPEVYAFGVLSALPPERVPRVVFVTANEEREVQAFKSGALDCLIKPYDLRRFEQVLAHVRADLHLDRAEYARRLLAFVGRAASPTVSLNSKPYKNGWLDRLLIKGTGRVFFVRVSEIDWVEAADNYVRIHVGKNVHLVRQTLASVEASFDPSQFARIHRGALVNLDSVVEILQGVSRDYLVLLKDGTELRLSDRYRRQIEERGRPRTEHEN
jgi:two-component system LytT family response regulator